MIFKKIKKVISENLLKKGESQFGPNIRAKQVVLLGSSVFFLVVSGGIIWMRAASGESAVVAESKEVEKKVSDLTTPLKVINENEIFANRVEKKTDEVMEEVQSVKQENELLKKQVDVLNDLFSSQKALQSVQTENLHLSTQRPLNSPVAPIINSQSSSGPQSYPPSEVETLEGPAFNQASSEKKSSQEFQQKIKKKGPKIVHIGSGKFSSVSYRTKDTYLPSGSFIKAVCLSGVVASTAVNAQSNPEPLKLRLIDDGNLPRGFKSRVKDAHVWAYCHGDVSSERAKCRLHSMSWVEPDGVVVEKKLEGWVFGEDGREGLRGEIVDRAGERVREAVLAGMLSSVADFFKMQSERSVYPISPLGQSNALGAKDALSAAGASGVSGGLGEVAKYSIKRAEQMQPVILISSGRLVDISLLSGVDLSPLIEEPIKVMGNTQETSSKSDSENE